MYLCMFSPCDLKRPRTRQLPFLTHVYAYSRIRALALTRAHVLINCPLPPPSASRVRARPLSPPTLLPRRHQICSASATSPAPGPSPSQRVASLTFLLRGGMNSSFKRWNLHPRKIEHFRFGSVHLLSLAQDSTANWTIIRKDQTGER